MSTNNTNRSVALIVLLMLFGSTKLHAQLDPSLNPSTGDLWDVSGGTVVTNNSVLLSGIAINDMFGAVTPASLSPGNVLYTDAELAGFVHSVEWQMPASSTLSSMVLNARHDGPPFTANERGFSQFTLYARNPGTGLFDIILVQYNPGSPYATGPQPADGVSNFSVAGDALQLCVNFPAVTAQEFRAEFVQFGDSSPLQRGPRINELDGYGSSPCPSVAPPPASFAPVPTLTEWALILLAMAVAGFGVRNLRRKST